MNPILKSALIYLTMGFSIIPVGDDKRPLIAWAKYQSQHPTEQEVKDWWTQYPKANVAIVTGKLSNLTVVDIDTEEGKKNIKEILGKPVCPIVTTPRGGLHLYFRYHEGLRNNAKVIPGTDLRAEGGYVVAPPSVLNNGKRYNWKYGYNLKTDIPPVPQPYLDAIAQHQRAPEVPPPPQLSPGIVGGVFTQGRRDEDLFHLANKLVKSGAEQNFIIETLLRTARTCNPPFPEKEAMIKVKSAYDRALRQEVEMTQDVDEAVRMTTAWFTAREICGVLGIHTPEGKKYALNRLLKLANKGVLEKHPRKNATYRMINTELTQQEWWTAEDNPLAISLPMELDQWLLIYPGNTVVLAGLSNWGKTTFFIRTALLNLGKFKFRYLNSEMDNPELKKRFRIMKLLENRQFQKDVKFYPRSADYHDVIEPNSINFVDYISLSEEHYRMRGIIEQIDDKLENGVAFISLQKPPGRDFGLGGYGTIERARLYLSLDAGKMKCVKAKNWKDYNPNGKTMNFQINDQYEFISLGGWYDDEDSKMKGNLFGRKMS